MVLSGEGGIRAAEFMKVYLDIPVYTVIAVVGTLLAFMGLFMATAYYALNRRFRSDLPEGQAEPLSATQRLSRKTTSKG